MSALQPPASLPSHVALLLAELPMDRPTTILDVGANPIHNPHYKALLEGGGCNVIGFEPQEEAFAELQRQAGPRETYYPHAVGDGGVHDLHVHELSGFTSLFAPHLPSTRVHGSPRWTRVKHIVPVQTVALDALPDLGPVDLLATDIQGGEKLVIDNARQTLSEAVAVIVELRCMRLYDGEPMMGGVDESLRAQGFMLHKFLTDRFKPLPNSQSARLNPRRTSDQLWEVDAIYLRHLGRIDGYSDAQLMHLALLAASVFSSHSLAVHVLDELVRRKLARPALPASYVDSLPAQFVLETPPARPVPRGKPAARPKTFFDIINARHGKKGS